MDNSYIKLYRKCLDGGWLKNGDLWRFWCYCLLKATHKQRTTIVGYQKIDLEPGQFIFGRKIASKEIKMSERTIRTCLSTLTTLQNLTIKSTNKFSIITIVNWRSYQSREAETTSKSTSNRPATDQQPTTDKNVKEVKEKEILEAQFEIIWLQYPNKQGKKKSLAKWLKATPNEETRNKMLAWVTEDKRLRAVYIFEWWPDWKNFETWFNNECWLEPHYSEGQQWGQQSNANGDTAYCSKHNKFFPLHSKCPECP